MKKKLVLPLICLLIISLIMTACAAPSAPDPTPAGQPAAETKQETSPQDEKPTEVSQDPAPSTEAVRTDIRTALTADVGSLDPTLSASGVEGTVKRLMYEGLINKVYSFDEAGNTIRINTPAIAESWEFSPDFKELTFHLRKGVKFHNGDDVKASDIVFSVDMFAKSPNGKALLGPYVSTEIIDDSTVKLVFSEIYPVILDRLPIVSIMSEKYVKEVGEEFGEKPMGTGPYKLVEHIPLQSFKFEAFEDYWAGPARIKTIQMDILPDATAAMMAFEAGKLDLIGVPEESVERVKNAGTWEVKQLEGIFPLFLIMNFENEALGNLKVRQALSYGINKENNVLLARDGQGKIADYFFNPDLMVNSCKPDFTYTYDLEKAKSMLEEAGYKDGVGIPELTLKVVPGLYEKSALVLQQDFEEMGITVKIEVMETNAWIDDIINGNFDLALNNASMSELVYPWGMFFQSQYLNQVNMARIQDPVIDELFDNLGKTMDDEEQKAIIKDIVNYVNDNAVYIPISYPLMTTAYDKNLKMDGNPRETSFYNYYWEK